jgi:hypothetical protein
MGDLMKALILLFVVTLILVLWTITSPATQAQGGLGCVPVQTAIQKMKEIHGEVPLFRGVSRGGYIIIVFLNSDTGTWTAGQISPSRAGFICAIDAGESGETELNLLKKGHNNGKSKIVW